MIYPAGEKVVLNIFNNAFEEYLLALFRAEAESRDKKAEAGRIKQARLPTYKGFDEFDTNFQKGKRKS